MRTLICGSLAFDTIMVFHDRFKQHILPEQLHILNVAFLVPDLRREYGGCAGNIAYNLKLLKGEPVIMAAAGGLDFTPYQQRLLLQGQAAEHIRLIPDSYTAQAYITTDLDDNQITAFHPGAMNFSHENKVGDATDIGLGIISPDGRQGMLDHARQFHEAGIPFVFDPGQGLPMFNGEELNNFLQLADYCSVNDYEAKLLSERTGRSLEDLATDVKALIVTLGGAGSHIYVDGKCLHIPCVPAAEELDPTGCGDAYRAGLLYGIANGLDWEQTGRLASLMGAIKIASRGGQNHAPSREEIGERYRAAFGANIW